ncbi:MAG: hypothetical protein IJH76_05125 [Clostridia bacterium]|nr:hypothetical protein [Clostridia bacterium]
MEKKIHYCWFGGKPLPTSVKKCIKTWKKILPDYEIIQWNEKNFDINSCNFVKEAYENKKWAFVSDYARIYALYNEGGIYLDTDVKILKDIDDIREKNMFMGYEDSGYFGTAVIGVKEKHNKYIKEILDYYDKLEHFYIQSIYNYTNPIIITNIIKKYECKTLENGVKLFDGNIYIYPREYFYPISYDYSEKLYTKNTRMVHLFKGTWTSKGEKRTIGIYRKCGPKLGKFINKSIDKIGNIKNSIKWNIQNFVHKWAIKYSIYVNRNKRVNKIKQALSKQSEKYVAICHPEWIGVKNSTKYTFGDNILEIREQYTKKEAYMISKEIVNAGKKMVVFNAFANGWENIITSLKEIKPDIIVKLIIHGGNALLSECYDWEVHNIMLNLYERGQVDELCFVKKSLYEFYKAKGYNSSFLMNDVIIENKEQYIPKNKDNKVLKIGLYSSGDRWVKNTYNQISAISLFEDVKLDCIPINSKISTLCRRYKVNLTGEETNVPKEEIYKRIANNDINVYVTFTECAPLIPLESLELGTVCITGDNHHYFTGTELEKYLVVTKEDDIMEIYNKIKYDLENREKILELYKEWKKEYSKKAKESVEKFLSIE